MAHSFGAYTIARSPSGAAMGCGELGSEQCSRVAYTREDGA
ncbi:MAG: hypothetical protein OJF49_000696 [Ktedonobacterales bacterium]|nr:MAG: hypothetical protein OJF49_000696 [Ktedonobacterales bacterium]